jgi:hypothetical protein
MSFATMMSQSRDAKARYGAAPLDLGKIDLAVAEMMFWLYCPISLPGTSVDYLPDNLKQFDPILDAVYADAGDDLWFNSYVYLSAKVMYVSPDSPGNRPGWHSDGYLSSDLNYIWADANPTEFWQPPALTTFSPDHQKSLFEMALLASDGPIVTYPTKHLLRLDETVIHRVSPNVTAGVRSFVKVSISPKKYDLIGNSINHALPKWAYEPRAVERNHPSST